MLYTTRHDQQYELLFGECGLYHVSTDHYNSMPSPHFHDDYEIYFLVQGNRKYFLANKICDLFPGDILLINHHEPHQATLDSHQPYERYLLHISPKMMTTLCKEYKELADFINTRSFRADNETFQEILRTLELLKKESQFNDAISKATVKNLVARILLLLYRAENAPDHEVLLTEKNDIRLQNSINYIVENYAEPITLEQCAKIAYMSPSHFSRLFHRLTSMSFKEYLNKLRVQKACELLKKEKVSVTDLAMRVGFNSSSYFNQVFKELTATTPLAYRKNN
jgi:AraC-like DNA-binding protein